MSTRPVVTLARALALAAAVTSTQAVGYELTEAERDVPLEYRHVALQYGIPYVIFYAVLLAESGMRDPETGRFRPWPWTLNIGGKEARFGSREAAAETLRDTLESGRRNVDIGQAQINYLYNAQMLPRSLYAALDPETNLGVAAGILRRELRRCATPDWWCAVARYHSPGPSTAQRRRAADYVQRVRRYWVQLVVVEN